MQSMQRQFGKLWTKGPGDNAKVSVILNDYEDSDKMLAKIIDSARSWRDSWVNLVGAQLQAVAEFEGLYDPIVGATDGHGRPSVPTPELQLHRTFKLKEAYAELKTELLEEVAVIEERVIKPASDARDYIAPIRKTIKKREAKRIDYEKCQEKVNKLHKKTGKTAKDDAALVKAQDEMTRVADEFGVADEHLRQTLPPIIAAAFSLIPPLLAGHVLIQNRLLGLYYTTLHGYCEDAGFPSPPPPMADVVAVWNASYAPARLQVESITVIARGKSIHQPLSIGDTQQQRKPSVPSQEPKDNFRRSSSGLIPGVNNGPAPRALRIPSQGSLQPPSPTPSNQPSPRASPGPGFRRPDYLAPTDFTTATVLGGTALEHSAGTSPGSVRPRADYFGHQVGYQARPSTASTVASTGSSVNAANGVAKKKPPPPPPPKKIPSTKPEEWVVAQFDFAGQGPGDLSFREGDRIKIVKKTETEQDWWVGELNGARGSFPANYCRTC
ncbi:hypothetical protein GQ53DRAFT_731028 [Thozetella sp. PMI_491]|nr:hypothetical protein GQ53DRAFT_731028 [Thozetella sp. PMI_491]